MRHKHDKIISNKTDSPKEGRRFHGPKASQATSAREGDV